MDKRGPGKNDHVFLKHFKGIRFKLFVSFLIIFPVMIILSEVIRLYGLPLTLHRGYLYTEKSKILNNLNQLAELNKRLIINQISEIKNDFSIFLKGHLEIDYLLFIAELINNKEDLHDAFETPQFKHVKDYLDVINQLNNIFTNVDIVNPDSMQIIVSSDLNRVGRLYKYSDIIKRGTESDQISVSDGHFDSNDNFVIVVAASILDKSDYEHYHDDEEYEHSLPRKLIIAAHIDIERMLSSLLDFQYQLGQTGEVYLVNEDYKLINQIWKNQVDFLPLEKAILSRAALLSVEEDEGVLETVDYKGEKVFAAYKHLRISPEWGWGLVLKQSTDELMTPVIKNVFYLVFRDVMIFLILLFVSYCMILRIVRPILTLHTAVASVENLNFDIGLEPAGNDEIGQLTDAFIRMTRKLHDWQGELEKELSVRTASLLDNQVQLEKTIKEKDVLYREVNHRIKNNLYMIKSFLYLQSDYIEDEGAKRVLKNCEDRINSILLIHKQLYRKNHFNQLNTPLYIKELVNILISTYYEDGSEIIVESDIENINLNIDTAIPCALLINEIISNSLKYAFKGKQAENILTIKLMSNSDDKLWLYIGDNGPGIPADYLGNNDNQSFGLLLVDLLVKQLRGVVTIDNSNGTNFSIEFNLNTMH